MHQPVSLVVYQCFCTYTISSGLLHPFKAESMGSFALLQFAISVSRYARLSWVIPPATLPSSSCSSFLVFSVVASPFLRLPIACIKHHIRVPCQPAFCSAGKTSVIFVPSSGLLSSFSSASSVPCGWSKARPLSWALRTCCWAEGCFAGIRVNRNRQGRRILPQFRNKKTLHAHQKNHR